jgi:dihydroxy-acid dehydratase
MEDVHKVGGTPAVMKYLLEEGFLEGNVMTVTGKTLAENLSSVPSLDFSTQDVIRPLSNPIKATGHLRIFKGNFCPGGAVGKITGKEGTQFRGKAMCFEDEQSALDALKGKKMIKNTVVVLRTRGPAGAPGMPEQLKLSGAIMGESGEQVELGNTRSLTMDTFFPLYRRGTESRCRATDRWSIFG